MAYRWHAWFGRTVHVHELIDRNAGVVARCRLDDRAIQEVPIWMLDAATCATMHEVATPQASASALAALSALLSEVMARSPSAGEAPAAPARGQAVSSDKPLAGVGAEHLERLAGEARRRVGEAEEGWVWLDLLEGERRAVDGFKLKM